MPTPASGAKPGNPDLWLVVNGQPLSFSHGHENLQIGAREYSTATIRITPAAPDDLVIEVDGQVLETERYGSWLWDPRGYAGVYRLRVSAPGQPPHEATVRVMPTRLTYARYMKMLADIAGIATDLLLELHSPATERAAVLTRAMDQTSALRDYELLQRIFVALPDVLSSIERRPHQQLAEVGETRLLQDVAEFSADAVPDPAIHIALAAGVGRPARTLPLYWTVQRRGLTYNVPENRLVKHFLTRQLLPRLGTVRRRAENEISRRRADLRKEESNGWADSAAETRQAIGALEDVLRSCARMAARGVRWADAGYLRDAGGLSSEHRPTQLLQKHPHYGRFYRLYLEFQSKLRITLNSESFTAGLHMRKVWELYQLWCSLLMSRIVQHFLSEAGYVLAGDDRIFRRTEEEFHLEFQPGASIDMSKADTRVRIRYEPLYPSDRTGATGFFAMYPAQLTPDVTVEIWRAGKPEALLVFDAKYRADPTGDGAGMTCKPEDLDTADKYYRRLGVRRTPAERGRACVISSYLLYPGNVLEHDRAEPEVGAIPLVPGQPDTEFRQAVGAVVDLLRSAVLF